MNKGLPRGDSKGIRLQSVADLKSQKSPDMTTDVLKYLVTKIYNQSPETLSFADILLPILSEVKNLDQTEEVSQATQII